MIKPLLKKVSSLPNSSAFFESIKEACVSSIGDLHKNQFGLHSITFISVALKKFSQREEFFKSLFEGLAKKLQIDRTLMRTELTTFVIDQPTLLNSAFYQFFLMSEWTELKPQEREKSVAILQAITKRLLKFDQEEGILLFAHVYNELSAKERKGVLKAVFVKGALVNLMANSLPRSGVLLLLKVVLGTDDTVTLGKAVFEEFVQNIWEILSKGTSYHLVETVQLFLGATDLESFKKKGLGQGFGLSERQIACLTETG